jgi:hypothetical protein
MSQTKSFTIKLGQGESVDITSLNLDDVNFSYSFQTAILLGAYDELINVNINGIDIQLPGGFVYNHTPITTFSVTSSTNGVLLIGLKTKREIFGQYVNDMSINSFMFADYIDDYFE